MTDLAICPKTSCVNTYLVSRIHVSDYKILGLSGGLKARQQFAHINNANVVNVLYKLIAVVLGK